MIRVFIGYDQRQPVVYHTLCQSIINNTSSPVQITPLVLSTLPIQRKGLTDFTYSRFLVPWLCGFVGDAIFMDSDMIVRGDLQELRDIMEETCAPVSTVKFGPELAYENPSFMYFNNAVCTRLLPDFINDPDNALYDFAWAGGQVGTIPLEWNHLVGYQEKTGGEKLVHFTQGSPCYKECRFDDYSDEWYEYHKMANSSPSWLEIMGRSKHANHVLKRLAERQQC